MLEVLISMFVLAVGLLSVAALIPAGRYEIAQSTQLDNTAMIGRAAFRDIAVRNYLYPGNATGTIRWRTEAGAEVWDPDNSTGAGTSPAQPFVAQQPTTGNPIGSAQVAVAIDPLGLAAGYAASFPTFAAPGDPHLTRISPIIPGVLTPPREYWDSVFRSSIDLTAVANPANSDLPPRQYWFRDPANSDPLTNVIRRASQGDYSWLATVVSDPTKSALNSKVTVSVAVFHKRNLSSPGAGESVAQAFPSGGALGIGGGEMGLNWLSGSSTGVRPGEWLMLAGWRYTGNQYYYRWYRVVAAGRRAGNGQNVTLAGADWDRDLLDTGTGITWAFLFDNIVAVYEKNLSLKIE